MSNTGFCDGGADQNGPSTSALIQLALDGASRPVSTVPSSAAVNSPNDPSEKSSRTCWLGARFFTTTRTGSPHLTSADSTSGLPATSGVGFVKKWISAAGPPPEPPVPPLEDPLAPLADEVAPSSHATPTIDVIDRKRTRARMAATASKERAAQNVP